jgi:hypothetical protein
MQDGEGETPPQKKVKTHLDQLMIRANKMKARTMSVQSKAEQLLDLVRTETGGWGVFNSEKMLRRMTDALGALKDGFDESERELFVQDLPVLKKKLGDDVMIKQLEAWLHKENLVGALEAEHQRMIRLHEAETVEV